MQTSLIVTPPTLAGQWYDELCAHAPSLKVLLYEGWTKIKGGATHPNSKDRTKLT